MFYSDPAPQTSELHTRAFTRAFTCSNMLSFIKLSMFKMRSETNRKELMQIEDVLQLIRGEDTVDRIEPKTQDPYDLNVKLTAGDLDGQPVDCTSETCNCKTISCRTYSACATCSCQCPSRFCSH